MHDLLMTQLPPVTNDVKGCWFDGYPVHQGYSEESLNYATLYAKKHGIIPDQRQLRADWENLVGVLHQAGFTTHLLEFPEELNQPDCLYHDAVFIRDVGLMYQDYWIQGNFSARGREIEAEVYGKIIPGLFDRQSIFLPEDAYLEFGEVFYLNTAGGSYYFGGLSRSNRKGHEFVIDLLQPDYHVLINSVGYHLDTVFTPVLGPEDSLDALILAPDMIYDASQINLRKLDLDIIEVEPVDASGKGKSLGNYAVNALVAPGVFVNCCEFRTPEVEYRLHSLGIKRYITPLDFFKYAGGSVHCLTTEIYS